eukprot:466729-Amphidinium_carterae.1
MPTAWASDCREVVKAVQALQTGRRTPKGRNREKKALAALLPGQGIMWMKAHLKQADVHSGRITADDVRGNGQADDLANQGTAVHGHLEPDATWLSWSDFANKVFFFWRLVGRQPRERPDNKPRVRLPAEVVEETPVASSTEMVNPDAPLQIGPHLRANWQSERNIQLFLSLLKKKVKKRPTGFIVTTARSTSPTHNTPAARPMRENKLLLLETRDLSVPGVTGTSSAEPGTTGHLFRQVLPAGCRAARLLAAFGPFSASGHVT